MQAYDGQQGWRIDGFKNEKKKTLLKGRQGTAMANEADVELESPFINYHKKGYTVLLEGKDTVNNKTCYKIKLMRENVDTSTFFFDDKNFSMVKKTAISKNTEMDNALMDIYYSDYQVTAGIKTPRKIACLANGQNILIITVKSVKLNLPIDNKIFKP